MGLSHQSGPSSGGSAHAGGSSTTSKPNDNSFVKFNDQQKKQGQSQGQGGNKSNQGDNLGDKVQNSFNKVEDKAKEIGQKFQNSYDEVKNNVTTSIQGQGQGQGQDQSGSSDKKINKDQYNKPSSGENSNNGGSKPEGTMDSFILGTQDMLSKPMKPVGNFLDGAFKTSDELRWEHDKMLAKEGPSSLLSEKQKKDDAIKNDRSITGTVLDKAVTLAEKPFELLLKPVDKLFGFDKDGKKNPLIRMFDSIYGLSKKPVDAISKPVEKVLKKMGGQPDIDNKKTKYEVAIRWNESKNKKDPKIVSRIVDGTLTIADRAFTRPLEIIMRPFSGILGFDGEKNPIVEASHNLKNATLSQAELFTRPLDRMIEEIAQISDYKNPKEMKEALERRKNEATRVVRVMDKIHEMVQRPFEIVLSPISQTLGFTSEGEKSHILLAWDVIHHVLRTPAQVITKPIEDAIFHKDEEGSRDGLSEELGQGSQVNSLPQGQERGSLFEKSDSQKKSNVFVDKIKKFQRFYFRPIDLMTSPLRRIIMGKHKDDDDDNNSNKSDKDRIVKAVTRLNNVFLKPLEIATQPISDILTGDGKEENSSEKKKNGDNSNNSHNGGFLQKIFGSSTTTQKPLSSIFGQGQGGNDGSQSSSNSNQQQQKFQPSQNSNQQDQSQQNGQKG